MHQSFVRRLGRLILAIGFLLVSGCPGTGGTGGALDSDGDGFSDAEERNAFPGSDPLNPNDTPDNPIDTDGDGCSDFDELNFENFCDNDPETPVDELPPGTSNRFSLQIVRHVDQAIAAGEVDGIFETASELLQTVQTECPDLATDVTFERSGEVETFDVGSSIVTSEAQLDNLFELPGDFKVVEEMIGVCGSTPSTMTTLLGCSFEGGSVVIIADAPPDVWAHEWGHVQGLGHRDSCRSNIMHTTELETNAVNQFERNAFLSPGPRNTTAKAAPGGPPDVAHLRPSTEETVEGWLERIVGRSYRSGIPAELLADLKNAQSRVSRLPGSRTPAVALREMLPDPRHAAHRANIVRLLGLAGDVESIPALMASVVAPSGPLTREQFSARSEALLALGRLLPADRTGLALEFLAKGADPQSWSERGVSWRFRSYEGSKRNELLARLSIMALGLSQDQAALAHLRATRERINAGMLDAAQFADQVDEAIARCQGLEVKSRLGIPLQQ